MLGLERLVFRQYRGSIENGTNELEDHGDSVHRGSEDLESNEMKRQDEYGNFMVTVLDLRIFHVWIVINNDPTSISEEL